MIGRAALAVTLCVGWMGPAQADDMLSRLQGLYYPDLAAGAWDCRSVGRDGGALEIRGAQMFGVETMCNLRDPLPIPGMDAVRYLRDCAGEGMTWEGDPVILSPTASGVALMFDGFATEWVRCP